MIRTDWIKRNGSLYDLMCVFSDAKEDLFKTELFKILITGFWDDLSTPIFFSAFIPFTIFLAINLYYLTYFMYARRDELEEED